MKQKVTLIAGGNFQLQLNLANLASRTPGNGGGKPAATNKACGFVKQ
jgi:hypothetical protein